jgi:hypothetical protein
LARIGAEKGLTTVACLEAVSAPFEERLSSFLDLLYCDARRAGVTGRLHAQVLFRWWLDLSKSHDHEHNAGLLSAYFGALMPFYPPPSALRSVDPEPAQSYTRKESEAAMRAPFEDVVGAYMRRLYDPGHDPGIRDEAHARATFVTYCQLASGFSTRRHRGSK